MTEPPLIKVSFSPAQVPDALFAVPRQEGAPLVWRSSFIPPFEEMLNLDAHVMLDLVGGQVEQVEILHLKNAHAQSLPANDTARTHRMIVDLSNRDEVERQVLISSEREGADLLFRIEGAPRPERCFWLGGGLGAMVAGDALSGFRVSAYFALR